MKFLIVFLTFCVYSNWAQTLTKSVLGSTSTSTSFFNQKRPEPAQLQHNQIYRLEIQSEDKFLTGVANGFPNRSIWRNQQDQKWKFEKTKSQSEDTWKITPINKIGGLSQDWKVSYVGHGKYQFKNVKSGLCLNGHNGYSVNESKCQRDSPYQRWLVQVTQP